MGASKKEPLKKSAWGVELIWRLMLPGAVSIPWVTEVVQLLLIELNLLALRLLAAKAVGLSLEAPLFNIHCHVIYNVIQASLMA